MNLVRYAIASAVMLIPAPQVIAQVVFCPTPYETGETLQQQILELGERHAPGIDGLVVQILTVDPPEVCPILRADQNPRQVLDQLVRFAVGQRNAYLADRFFIGLAAGLLGLEERGLPRPVSIDLLRFAVENGRDPGRTFALRTAEALTQTPEVRALLLNWARAPRGPASWPELPEVVITRMHLSPESRVLLDDLRAEPQRIRNTEARCLAQHGLEHHVPFPRCRAS
jgi:hypothetical protein